MIHLNLIHCFTVFALKLNFNFAWCLSDYNVGLWVITYWRFVTNWLWWLFLLWLFFLLLWVNWRIEIFSCCHLTIPFCSDWLYFSFLFLLACPCFAARCNYLFLRFLDWWLAFLFLFLTCTSRPWPWSRVAFAYYYWERLLCCKDVLWSFNTSFEA